jgi:transposase
VIDEVIDVPLPSEECPCCGGELGEEEIQEQFFTDIPPIRPRTTQFNVHCAHCLDCGERIQGHHPLQSSDALGAASCQIGPNAISFAAHLNKCLGTSYGRIANLFSMIFCFTVARSTLARAINRLGEKAEPLYSEITVIVRQSQVVYPDETGWKIGGTKAWLWDFVSLLRRATLYTIRPSRGGEVAAEVLGADFAGTLGHDGWSPYDSFCEASHQQCVAHLLRRCRELLEVATRGAVRFPRQLKELLQDAILLRDRRDRKEVSPHGLAVATGKLEKRLDRLLTWTRSDEANERLAKHIDEHRGQIVTFLRNPDVEATNWPAEQAIRPAVVNRKLSGGNRTERGARVQSILMSIFRTCWQQGLNPIELLVNLQRTSDPRAFAATALGAPSRPKPDG